MEPFDVSTVGTRMRSRVALSVVALLLSAAAGAALAQQTGGNGRSGPAPECVGGKRVLHTAPRAPAAMRACHANAECVIAPVGCCESCGVGPATGYRAVARSHEAAWRRHVCPRIATCPACVAGHDSDV